ncbi:DNA-binding protein [Streptomyces longwoodensis]|uniref:DNA-binding protein n=1 Tax=Streptomyces longwoodensis TaxID=68231 RepID=UPI0037FD64A0
MQVALFAFSGVQMADDNAGYVDVEAAAWYAGRPAATIRRWASEGRIRKCGSRSSGGVRYYVFDLNKAPRDEYTRALIEPGTPPPLPAGARAA